MKAVILAGGMGTRIAEETHLRPKPMIEVGGRPLLHHIMRMYSAHSINHFVVCLGYKGYMIKEYFANYFLHRSDVTIDLSNNKLELHDSQAEPWKITLIDTGEHTMTGGRLRRVAKHLQDEEWFCMTYGDGLSDVNISELVGAAKKSNKLATLTAVQPPGRYGALKLDGGSVTAFQEKPEGDGGWVNGGFFVLKPEVLGLIQGDDTIWEREPLEELARRNELDAFFHTGFWQPLDTLRDKLNLEESWKAGAAPWTRWDTNR